MAETKNAWALYRKVAGNMPESANWLNYTVTSSAGRRYFLAWNVETSRFADNRDFERFQSDPNSEEIAAAIHNDAAARYGNLCTLAIEKITDIERKLSMNDPITRAEVLWLIDLVRQQAEEYTALECQYEEAVLGGRSLEQRIKELSQCKTMKVA